MIVDFLVALLIALVLTWFFAVAVGTTGPWPGFWVFFLVVLMFSWAIGLWVRPIGPALWGFYWLPYLVFGALIALLIAAATPIDGRSRRSGPPSRPPRGVPPEEEAVAGAVVAVGTLLWIALAVMAFAIAIGYLW
jgi:hypothetical protein